MWGHGLEAGFSLAGIDLWPRVMNGEPGRSHVTVGWEPLSGPAGDWGGALLDETRFALPATYLRRTGHRIEIGA
jgi:hypothetical protein